MSRIVTALIATAALTATAHAATTATTVPFTEAEYSEAGSFVTDPSHFDFVQSKHSAPASPASATYSNNDGNGAVTAFASADLTAGQLKIRGSASAPVGSGYPPYTGANAIIGEGFTTRTAGGQPFAWTTGTAAQFTFNLGGTITSNANGAPSSLSDAGGGVFLDLQILKPGTVTPDTLLVGAPTAIANYFYTFDGTTNQIYYNDPAGNHVPLTPTTAYANLPSTITQVFNPGGDFDWTLVFGLAGQTHAGADFNIDLAHTLTIGYAAPDGAATTAASGLFTNISNLPPAETGPVGVPEPGAAALLLTALLGLAGVRARRG